MNGKNYRISGKSEKVFSCADMWEKEQWEKGKGRKENGRRVIPFSPLSLIRIDGKE